MVQDSASKVSKTRKATWICLLVNTALSVVKFVCGMAGNSQAIVADAVHTFSDSFTDAAIIVGVGYWSKPPDETHPHGHRRIETLVTICIAGALFAVACGLTYNAVTGLKNPYNHPGWIAVLAAAVSLISKEVLYRWTERIGRKLKSRALVANAWHHRSDAISSIPAALAAAGAAVSPSLWFLDNIGAVVVSVFIVKASWDIADPCIREIIDTGAPEKDLIRIKSIALDTPGVQSIHAVRSRYIGSLLQIDLHVQVDPEMSVREGHAIASSVTNNILTERSDVADVMVHLEPFETGSTGNPAADRASRGS